eukprot:gene8619-34062_t
MPVMLRGRLTNSVHSCRPSSRATPFSAIARPVRPSSSSVLAASARPQASTDADGKFALLPCVLATLVLSAGAPDMSYAQGPSASSSLEQQDQMYDENLETKELRDFRALLERKASPKNSELEGSRLKSPGFQLLRGPDGTMYYLPPDEAGRILQVDLSDDLIVAELFSNGAWQDVMEPLKVENNDGKVVPLVMDLEDFKNVVTLLEDAEDIDVD